MGLTMSSAVSSEMEAHDEPWSTLQASRLIKLPPPTNTPPIQTYNFSQTRLFASKDSSLSYRRLASHHFVSLIQHRLPYEIWRYIFRLAVSCAQKDCDDHLYSTSSLDWKYNPEHREFQRERILAHTSASLHDRFRFQGYQIHNGTVDPEELSKDAEYMAWLNKYSWIRAVPVTQVKDLSQVCHLWRQILTQECQFWANIYIFFGDDGNEIGPTAVEQAFKRSGSFPVSLHWLADGMNRLPAVHTLHVFREQFSHVTNFIVNFELRNLPQNAKEKDRNLIQLFFDWGQQIMASRGYSKLESIQVKIDGLPADVSPHFCTFMIECFRFLVLFSPLLKRVTWCITDTFGIDRLFALDILWKQIRPEETRTCQLTHVDICGVDAGDVLYFLDHCPKLEECNLVITDFRRSRQLPLDIENGIGLHHLQDLRIKIFLSRHAPFLNDIFRYCTCPALKRLRISGNDHSDDGITPLLQTFLMRSACRLIDLELNELKALSGEDLVGILSVPSVSGILHRLKITRYMSIFNKAQALVDLLSLFDPQQTIRLPRLVELELQCRLDCTRPGSVSAMLKSRTTGVVAAQGLCNPLNTIVMFDACADCLSIFRQPQEEIQLNGNQPQLQIIPCNIHHNSLRARM